MPPLDDASRAALAAVLDGTTPGAVLEADNLDALAALPDGVVDLAYADPADVRSLRIDRGAARLGTGPACGG